MTNPLRMLLTGTLLTGVLAASDVPSGHAAGATGLREFTPPLAREKPGPRYPREEARASREGWVLLSFVVDERGRVIDPLVTESSGLPRFENAALRAVGTWTYEPALLDGVPIATSENQVLITFEVSPPQRAARPAFISAYRRVAGLMAEAKLDEAQEIIEDMRARFVSNLYEQSLLSFIIAQHRYLTGDTREFVDTLKRALITGDTHLPEEIHRMASRQLLTGLIELARFAEALKHHHDSERVRVDEASQVAATRIRELIRSDQPIVVESHLSGSGHGKYLLARRSFEIIEAGGTVDALELRCTQAAIRIERDGFLDRNISVPDHWGECWLHLRGTPGAAFHIHDLQSLATAR